MKLYHIIELSWDGLHYIFSAVYSYSTEEKRDLRLKELEQLPSFKRADTSYECDESELDND